MQNSDFSRYLTQSQATISSFATAHPWIFWGGIGATVGMAKERLYPRQKNRPLRNQNTIKKFINNFYSTHPYIYSGLEGAAISEAGYALWPYISNIPHYLSTSNPQQLLAQVTSGLYSLATAHPIKSFAIIGASVGFSVYKFHYQKLDIETGRWNYADIRAQTQHTATIYGRAQRLASEHPRKASVLIGGTLGASGPATYYYWTQIAKASTYIFTNPITYWAIGGALTVGGAYYLKTNGIKPIYKFARQAIVSIRDTAFGFYTTIINAANDHRHISIPSLGALIGIGAYNLAPYMPSIKNLSLQSIRYIATSSTNLYQTYAPAVTLAATFWSVVCITGAFVTYKLATYSYDKFKKYKERQSAKQLAKERHKLFQGSLEQRIFKDLALLFELFSRPEHEAFAVDLFNVLVSDREHGQEFDQALGQLTKSTAFQIYRSTLRTVSPQIIDLSQGSLGQVTKAQIDYKDLASLFNCFIQPENQQLLTECSNIKSLKNALSTLKKIYPIIAAGILEIAIEKDCYNLLICLPVNSIDITQICTKPSGHDAALHKAYNVTLLHYLIQKGEIRYAAELLEKLGKGNKFINVLDSKGMSALHWAAASLNIDLVRSLLAYGANPLEKDKKGFIPAVHALGDDDIINALVEAMIKKTIPEEMLRSTLEKQKLTLKSQVAKETTTARQELEQERQKLKEEWSKLEAEKKGLEEEKQKALTLPTSFITDTNTLPTGLRHSSESKSDEKETSNTRREKVLFAAESRLRKPQLQTKGTGASSTTNSKRKWQFVISNLHDVAKSCCYRLSECGKKKSVAKV